MSRRLHVGAVTALFVLLTVIHTWPLATNLAHLSRVDAADYQLNAWAISWIARTLPRDPLHLFDANIFHPEPRTLAYSEPLLVPALVGVPLYWLGGSPVVVHNVLTLTGLVAMGLGMYLLMIRFTNDRSAAILAGCLFAFNAHTLTRFPQLQAFQMQWLPLALWALDRVLVTGRWRDAGWLALFVTCAALTSGYLAVFVVVTLATAFLVRPDRWFGTRAIALACRFVAAALACTLAVAVVLWPYAGVDQGAPIVRDLPQVAMFDASLDDYLATGGRFHYELWSHRFYAAGNDALFPGIIALLLAGLGLVLYPAHPGAWMLGGVALVGCVLSFGTTTPVYEWLCWAFPPAQSLRASSRFGFLFLFGVAGLASFGLSALRVRWSGRRWRAIAVTMCLVLANLEALRAPVDYTFFSGFSPIYSAISRDPEARTVVEFPFPARNQFAQNAEFVLASTVHWQPLVNGYSGFVPASYNEAATRLRTFPDPPALRFLRSLDVTHVVVHPQRFQRGRAERFVGRVESSVDLQLLGVDDDGIRLYRLLAGNES